MTLKSIRKEGSENEDLTEMALKSNASKVQLFLKFVKKIEFYTVCKLDFLAKLKQFLILEVLQ